MQFPDWMRRTWGFMLAFWFPAHHRKITKTVVGVGAGLLLDSYLLNGLVQWLARLAVARLLGMEAPPWSEGSGDAALWPGVVVIGLGLLFSVLVLLIEKSAERSEREDAIRTREQNAVREQNTLRRDRALYGRFRDEFATGGRLEEFACHHYFGGSWPHACSVELNRFLERWTAPEAIYVTGELSALFGELLGTMTQLSGHLVNEAGPLTVNAERLCIYDPSLHNEMALPEKIDRAIREANRLVVRIREQREAFILEAERRFSALPNPE